MNNEYNTCDICGISNAEVKAGRWIFYCKKHKENDWDKTYDNEVAPALQDGDISDIDGEVAEMMLDNL